MFRERIAERYERLGRNRKKIAGFLTQEYRQAGFMNASMLSKELEVDPVTATGLARRLGYTRYPAPVREIQELVKSGSLRSCRLQVKRAAQQLRAEATYSDQTTKRRDQRVGREGLPTGFRQGGHEPCERLVGDGPRNRLDRAIADSL